MQLFSMKFRKGEGGPSRSFIIQKLIIRINERLTSVISPKLMAQKSQKAATPRVRKTLKGFRWAPPRSRHCDLRSFNYAGGYVRLFFGNRTSDASSRLSILVGDHEIISESPSRALGSSFTEALLLLVRVFPAQGHLASGNRVLWVAICFFFLHSTVLLGH